MGFNYIVCLLQINQMQWNFVGNCFLLDTLIVYSATRILKEVYQIQV